MNGFRADARYSEHAIRAANTRRWLDQSGPLYREVTGKMMARIVDSELWDGGTIRLLIGAEECEFSAAQMSLASWYICRVGALHRRVTIKARIDAVSLLPIAT